MKRVLLLVATLLVGVAPIAAAGEVAIADLIAESAAYDSSLVGEITVEGELVGDFQRRGDVVWVQVNGDAYATEPLLAGGDHAGSNVGIGASFPRHVFDALDVEAPGGYRVRGAIVRLTGEWRHHDPDRFGESYFAVRSAEVVEPESRLTEDARMWPFAVGGGLILVAGLIVFVTRRRPQ